MDEIDCKALAEPNLVGYAARLAVADAVAAILGQNDLSGMSKIVIGEMQFKRRVLRDGEVGHVDDRAAIAERGRGDGSIAAGSVKPDPVSIILGTGGHSADQQLVRLGIRRRIDPDAVGIGGTTQVPAVIGYVPEDAQRPVYPGIKGPLPRGYGIRCRVIRAVAGIQHNVRLVDRIGIRGWGAARFAQDIALSEHVVQGRFHYR